MLLYPNPTTGKFQVDDSFKGSVAVFNSLGEKIIELKEVREIDISQQANVIYFVHLINDGRSHTFRILKAD